MLSRKPILLVTGLCTGLMVTSAIAQTARPTPAGSADVLEEIIVTAQRKDENLSKTPVSVAVLTADDLAKSQVVSEEDLRFATPGLSVRAALSSEQLNFALRGQSQDAFSNTRPGVLPYINEVQISGSGASTAFYDLQSVQVLKGPQGTLFGRSATGGAVLYTTAKPTDDFSGYFSADGGNYGARKVEGAISGPIAGSVLLGRVAAFYQTTDGFQYNLYSGEREGGISREGFRASLSASPLDRGHNDLVVDYLHSDSGAMANVSSGLIPFQGPGTPPYVPTQYLYAGTATPQATATGIATLRAFTGASTAAATAYYVAYFADPRHPAGGLTQALADQQARGPYVIDNAGISHSRENHTVVTNSTVFELGSDTQIKNIVGFLNLKDLFNGEIGGPFIFSAEPNGSNTSSTDWSEELQLQGSAFNQRFSYTTGVFLSDEKITTDQKTINADLLFGGFTQDNVFEKKIRTYAGYAQGTYQLNDSGLAATLGARETSEKIRSIVLPGDVSMLALGSTAPAGYSYDQSTTYNKTSWQIGLQDQVNSNLLVYAVSRRAYKSGGYNGFLSPKIGYADTGGNAYKAEQVTDLEVGTKVQGSLGNMPVRANIALYNNWIKDSQRTAFSLLNNTAAALTVNVPTGVTRGLELDGQIKPMRSLAVGGNFNYTYASYGHDPVYAAGIAQFYDQVPDTPRYSGALFAEWTIEVSGDCALTLHADEYGQANSFTSAQSFNYAGTTVPSYFLTNFRAGLDISRGWTVTANVKNAFNRVYYVGGLPSGTIYQENNLVPGTPRTFGIDVRYKF